LGPKDKTRLVRVKGWRTFLVDNNGRKTVTPMFKLLGHWL